MSRLIERLPLLASRPALRYALTVAICAAMAWVRLQADSAFPPGYPFVTFFPAVIISSFLFGPRPGIVAGVLCGLLAWYFFIDPRQTFMLNGQTAVALLFYVGVVAIDIALVQLMQGANVSLREARQEVRTLAEERGRLADQSDVLFQEMQHRVGNNLQMVGAVLALQRRNLTEPSARRALSEAASRLQVIGDIQRQLYCAEGALVPLAKFLGEVATKVMAASGRTGIDCRVDADPDLELLPDSAVPVALILSEAIANALEHGMADREAGVIHIRMTRGGEQFTLTVDDDGAGLPPCFDADKLDSIGLRITRVLSDQLQARHMLEAREGGTRMTLVVPASRLVRNG